jgi:glycosyltransferase involved in cell wall biosynthesis
MLDAEPLPNVRWIEWATYDELRQNLAASDICLGIFGESDKAASVIPNKVFQIVAAGRPLITRDSDAIRELLGHAPPCTYLVPPGDPAALAEAISAHIKSKPSGESCHRELQRRIDETAVAKQFLSMIETRLDHSWTRN